jgi:ABC-type uncharacterized transport system substrate-binding protein
MNIRSWSKILFSFIIFVAIILTGPVQVHPENKRLLKIYIVNSYDEGHVCTDPQNDGFKKVIKAALNENFDIDYSAIYMETNVKNTTPQSMKSISQTAIAEINKYKPDFIYVTDDNAFSYVGIPMSSKYRVIFSGVNKPINDYISERPELNLKNLYGVCEVPNMTAYFKMLKKHNVVIDKYYIITDDGSETSTYIANEYRNILKSMNETPVIIKCETLHQFKKALNELQSKPSGLIMLTAQRLLNFETGKTLSKEEIIKELLKHNNRHLEVSINPLFAKIGLSTCVGPFFSKMGEEAGDILIKLVNGKPVTPQVFNTTSVISMNLNRIHYLGYSKLILTDDIVVY